MSAAETTEMQMVNLTINGQQVQARPGQTILEAAKAVGCDIPTLCHDPRLEPYGACRMCLVEVEGARGPMAACGTAVREGMKVETHSEKILKIRKFVLELLLTNHHWIARFARRQGTAVYRTTPTSICRHGALGLAGTAGG
jgi:predicted molibdopterin-dependent oxidoreductase YjgC